MDSLTVCCQHSSIWPLRLLFLQNVTVEKFASACFLEVLDLHINPVNVMFDFEKKNSGVVSLQCGSSPEFSPG